MKGRIQSKLKKPAFLKLHPSSQQEIFIFRFGCLRYCDQMTSKVWECLCVWCVRLLSSSFVLTGDELSDLHVVGLPQQAHEGWDAIAVLDGHLVVVVFAVGDVAQGPTSLAVDLRLGVVQKPNQNRNPLQLTHVFFNLVVFVAQVLQVGSRVGFDRVDRVPQHGDDLREIRIPPARVLADAVYGWRAPTAHPVQTSHAPPLRLGQRCWVHAVDVRVALINQLCLNRVIWVPSEGQKKKKRRRGQWGQASQTS